MERIIKKYRIASARLKEYDYSTPNWYFVTINTKDHHEYFGEIKNGKMYLNELGKIVKGCWEDITKHYPNTELDYFVVIPNHVHGIIIISSVVKTGHAPSLQMQTHTLGNIIGSFKSAVTKQIHEQDEKHFTWQSRFYDRIIRNERELNAIRNYIQQNPFQWELDSDNETLEF